MRFLSIFFSLGIHGVAIGCFLWLPQTIVQTELPTIQVQWEKFNTPPPPQAAISLARGEVIHTARSTLSYGTTKDHKVRSRLSPSGRGRVRDPIKSLQAKRRNPEPGISTSKENDKNIQRKSYKPLPKYPWICRKRGQEGCASLLIQTNEEGRVIRASLQKSSGYLSLDQSALNAVKTWLLPNAPGQQVVSIVFRLRG